MLDVVRQAIRAPNPIASKTSAPVAMRGVAWAHQLRKEGLLLFVFLQGLANRFNLRVGLLGVNLVEHGCRAALQANDT